MWLECLILTVVIFEGCKCVRVYYGPVVGIYPPNQAPEILIARTDSLEFRKDHCDTDQQLLHCRNYHHGFPHIYSVHHYYYDKNSISDRVSLATPDRLLPCDPTVQKFCTKNTSPLCLMDGTMMCVTKAKHKKKCGVNECVISEVPCVEGVEGCNSTTASHTFILGIPCVAIADITSAVNVNDLNNFEDYEDASSKNIASNELSMKKYCVTAVAKPKPKISPATSKAKTASKIAMFFLKLFIGY